MKRILLYGAGGCLAAFVAVAAVLYVKLDSFVKAAVEKWGPQVTRTALTLDSVRLSPFSGRGRIKGLFIGNPEGFKTPSALRLGSVKVAVDLKSLRTDRILVREILVDAPEVTYEGSFSGSNLARLQRNVESFAPPSQSGGKQAKLVIRLFKVAGGKVNLSLAGLAGKSLSVPLPDIELRDIGAKSGGATVGEAARQMLGAITGAAIRAAGSAGGAAQKATGLIQSLFGKKR